jgi:hypothetical protein
MIYNNTILKSKSVSQLIAHLKNEGFDNELKDYFERSKTYDDVQIIFLFRHIFEYVEKVNLRRIDNEIADLIAVIECLENSQLCSKIEYFDEYFIKNIVQKDFLTFKQEYGNYSNAIVGITKEYYPNSTII